MQTSDWLTFCGSLAAAIGLAFTWYGIHRGNRNSSAASFIALNEAWRQGWERFLTAKDEQSKQYQFAELLNILEIASALQVKNVFTGVARELLTEYLNSVMKMLNESEDAKNLLEPLIERETTYKYLRIYHQNLRQA